MRLIPATEVSIDRQDSDNSRIIAFEQMYSGEQPKTSTFTQLSVGESDDYLIRIVVTVNRADRGLTGYLTLTQEQTDRLIKALEEAKQNARMNKAQYDAYAASLEKK